MRLPSKPLPTVSESPQSPPRAYSQRKALRHRRDATPSALGFSRNRISPLVLVSHARWGLAVRRSEPADGTKVAPILWRLLRDGVLLAAGAGFNRCAHFLVGHCYLLHSPMLPKRSRGQVAPVRGSLDLAVRTGVRAVDQQIAQVTVRARQICNEPMALVTPRKSCGSAGPPFQLNKTGSPWVSKAAKRPTPPAITESTID